MPLKLNSFSGGSVTLDPASTASDFTHTLPAVSGTVVTTGSSAVVTQGMLASGVAGNGPAFSAFLGVNQSIPNNAATKLNLNTETFDTNNCFDTTLFRFTPNVAGYYFIAGATRIASGTFVSALIYKNGSLAKYGIVGAPVNSPYGVNVSGLIFMNGTTDFIELFTIQASGSAQNAQSGADVTYMDGFLARAV